MKSCSSLIFSSLRLFWLLDELLHQLGGLVPEVVVAHVHFDLVVVDVHDVGAHGVEEVPVVG